MMVLILRLRKWRIILKKWAWCITTPHHTFVTQGQWRSWAWKSVTPKSHASFPSERQKLADWAQQFLTSTSLNWPFHYCKEPSRVVFQENKAANEKQEGKAKWCVNKSGTVSEKKQLTKDDAERRIHAKDRSRGVRDAFLLAKRKENKLSTSYESEAYIVTGRHGDQVVMSPSQGVVLSH